MVVTFLYGRDSEGERCYGSVVLALEFTVQSSQYHAVIIWRSISMRARPAFLQFDWLKAGLRMDLPVFVCSHTKTTFKFLSRQGRYRAAFYVVGDLLLQTTQRESYRALVLSRLKSVKVY